MTDQSLEIANVFLRAINAADLEAMRALMTEDHTFTDALGNRTTGAATMVEAWRRFFEAIPGYWMRADVALTDGARVALFGEAGGGWRVEGRVLAERWTVRAAWLGEMEGGRVKMWSAYCDTGWGKPPAR